MFVNCLRWQARQCNFYSTTAQFVRIITIRHPYTLHVTTPIHPLASDTACLTWTAIDIFIIEIRWSVSFYGNKGNKKRQTQQTNWFFVLKNA